MISTVKPLLLSGSVGSVKALGAHIVSAIFPAISQQVVTSYVHGPKAGGAGGKGDWLSALLSPSEGQSRDRQSLVTLPDCP